MFANIEVWQFAAGLVLAVFAGALVFVGAMSRFLKRPSPSEAIIRIGRASTDVFIGRATWIVPILHRAATLSLSTIGLTIRRAGLKRIEEILLEKTACLSDCEATNENGATEP